MRSPFYFLVKPVDGKRYTNQRDNGLIVSSSQEDHTQTNRLALVVNTPVGYDGPVQIGDQILVHHNVFRIYYDMQGRERSSFNHVIDDVYYIEPDQFYMYIRDGVKMAVSPFVFIRPVSNEKEMSVYTQGAHKELIGEVVYSSEEYLSPGEVVSFKPHSEYEFYIDGEKLYRMSHNNVCIKL